MLIHWTLWLVYFVMAGWLLRASKAFARPPERRELILWCMAWTVQLLGLAYWLYLCVVQLLVVGDAGPAERTVMAAFAVQDLTLELLTWVSPGVLAHTALPDAPAELTVAVEVQRQANRVLGIARFGSAP